MTVNISKPEINIREKLTELDKPTGAAGSAMLRANSVHDQQDLLGVGTRNLIYNGDFQVWQRGTSFSTNTANAFTADRWKVVQGDAFNYDATITRSTSAPDGYKYSLLVTTDTAQSVATGQNGGISQALEGFDVGELGWGSSAAKDVTISFWVRSNATGLYALQLYVNRGGTTRAAYVVSYEIETSNKWEEKTIVIKGNAVRPFDAGDTGECLGVYFWHVGGSADIVSEQKWNDNTALFTSVTAHRNLFSDAGNTWQLAGVRMVVGSYPDGVPRITRPYGEELALCQRYYQKFDLASFQRLSIGYSDINNRAIGVVYMPVPLRTLASYGEGSLTVNGYDITSFSILHRDNDSHFQMTCTIGSTSLTVGNAYQIYAPSGGAFVEVNGEL